MLILTPRGCMQRFLPTLLLLLAATAAVTGCGSSSPSNKNVVAVVNLAPSSFSLVSGEVSTPLHATAQNSSGAPVATTFTFNSSNPALVTVSPSGLICAGVWDSTFVTCNGNDAQGNPLTGQAVVTATAVGISSAPVNVAVHPSVTSIQFDPASLPASGTCTSSTQTHQFVAKAFHNNVDITSQVGAINWTSTDFSVVSVDANGVATAHGAGQAGIVATVGNTTSTSTPFRTCMPTSIRLHVVGDTPGNLTTSATLAVNDTRNLQADWVDENGTLTNLAPVTFSTTNSAAVTLSLQVGQAIVTGSTPGGAIIVASCSPPSCGNGINQPVYSNPFTITVTGGSPATSIWAASTSPAGTSTLIPIDASKTPPAPNTPITLPGTPNSIVFARNGLKAYLGTAGGLASLDPAASVVSTVDVNTTGKVLAVSPDGTKVIISNATTEPDVTKQRLTIFDSTNSTLQTFAKPAVVAAEFTTDGFKAFIAANDGHIYVYSPFISLQTLTDAGNLHSVTTLPSGPLAYVANASTVDSFAVCDNSASAALPVSSPSLLLDRVPNANQIVSANSTGLDIVTATVNDAASGFCPQTASYTNQAINFGVGAITPNRLIVASNAAHIVVLPKGQPRVLVAIPGAGPGIINLAGGATEALSGGVTLDGNTLWVGAAGSNDVHLVNLLSAADTLQVQPNINGNNAPPDLVAVRPK